MINQVVTENWFLVSMKVGFVGGLDGSKFGFAEKYSREPRIYRVPVAVPQRDTARVAVVIQAFKSDMLSCLWPPI